MEDEDDEEEVTIIRIYGLNENNENVCVRVEDFTPYVYLELPDRFHWDQPKAQLLGDKIDELLQKKKPLKKCLMMKKKLYGANIDSKGQKKLFPYLFCSFSNKADARLLGYKIRKPLYISGLGAIKLKMHEQDANPILQMTSHRDIPTAGWVSFIGTSIDSEEKITICEHEFIVKWKSLEKVERDTVAKPKIMGFDIECYSTNPSAMPNVKNPGDKVFQISCVMSREGDSQEDYESFLLTLGEPDPDVVGDHVSIYMYETEADLLEGFTELIREENPNIITGYNILGFDIPYMIDRAKLNMCIFNFDKQGFHKYAHAKEKTISWSSSAYGNQEFQFLDAEGRLYVDLLPLVKRDFKMDNYKLKTISTYFLGQTKDPLSVQGIFKCYRIGIKRNQDGEYSRKARRAMGIVGKYCVQDSALVVRLMEKLQTWVGLCEMAKTCNVPIFTLYTKGQQIKVYSQVYKYCMYENIVVEKDGYVTRDDERYVGAHVFPPVPGVYDRVLPFDFASLYPTTIIAYNIDYSTIVGDEDDVPDRDCNVMEWEDHIGCAHDPKVIRKMVLTSLIDQEKAKIKALRDKRNSTLDRFRKKELMEDINGLTENMKPYVKERGEINKTKPKFPMCAQRYYRFLKSEKGKGVLPTILQNLLDARAHTRSEIKVHKVEVKRLQEEGGNEERITDLLGLINVLDKRQLAYKVSANSMYGAMGVRKGQLPFMPGAMCTTYMGRQNIELVAKTIPEKYGGELIYGDTDSNYIHFPHLQTAEESWDYAERVAAEVSALFPPPIKLEFEEVIYWRFFILTKKRYMYKFCGRDGVVGEKIGKKGVLLARRDNSQFIRTIYEQIIKKIFDRENRDDVLYFLIEQFNMLCSNCFDPKNFVVTKSIGSTGGMQPVPFVNEKGQHKTKIGDYTVPSLSFDSEVKETQLQKKGVENASEYYTKCLPAQVQLAEKMRRRGQRVDTGTRLEYVITETGGHTAKQYEKIESADYFTAHKDILKLDFMYYLKLLTNPIDQVLRSAYGLEDFTLKQYNYRLNVRTKMVNELKKLFTPRLVFENN